MAEKVFDIMRGKIRSLPFGSSCHNRGIFQVDNLCSFEDFCFGWPDDNGRKEIGKDGEVGKCNAPRNLDTRQSEVMMSKRRVRAWQLVADLPLNSRREWYWS